MSSLSDTSCKSIASSPPLDWQRIVSIEPQLAALAAEAAASRIPTSSCDFWPHWSRIKQRLSKFVGWDSRHAELSTCDAYEASYLHILELYELAGELAEEVAQ